jgi:hypothetical protein
LLTGADISVVIFGDFMGESFSIHRKRSHDTEFAGYRKQDHPGEPSPGALLWRCEHCMRDLHT